MGVVGFMAAVDSPVVAASSEAAVALRVAAGSRRDAAILPDVALLVADLPVAEFAAADSHVAVAVAAAFTVAADMAVVVTAK
jgi:hypothetical protein